MCKWEKQNGAGSRNAKFKTEKAHKMLKTKLMEFNYYAKCNESHQLWWKAYRPHLEICNNF